MAYRWPRGVQQANDWVYQRVVATAGALEAPAVGVARSGNG